MIYDNTIRRKLRLNRTSDRRRFTAIAFPVNATPGNRVCGRGCARAEVDEFISPRLDIFNNVRLSSHAYRNPNSVLTSADIARHVNFDQQKTFNTTCARRVIALSRVVGGMFVGIALTCSRLTKPSDYHKLVPVNGVI